MTCLHSYADGLQRTTRPNCLAVPDAVKKRRWGKQGQTRKYSAVCGKSFPCFSGGNKVWDTNKTIPEVEMPAFFQWDRILLRSVGVHGVAPRAQLVRWKVTQVCCHSGRLYAVPNAS